ncbi:chemotaxis protein CheW [Tuwongella immobilis]|uniref:CheW-like domain-containing protein n=1 Tax=Tuwongella immobilis TaxID=692036 RepID=A0A6C2YMF2_9BACT|nr:chemotaxis protein CheW [Tuwongella immobilis]VIP02255.1 chemotaxis protein : CheW purine-binding chemotaxis protein OS=Pyrococcus abyssi (strain GE5 / Orsay) GN=cheW PE=4 SV=1: CheW [Tuwongella immobilis]VTS00852.1 chemotaxis protein : CheW purine-binding chemotaxis protein OS=Pyrococcus abyssi (strain GE5 / Orsay) GN=cheW PE=4 SV=1: CheW [Tuwongella immobilis]
MSDLVPIRSNALAIRDRNVPQPSEIQILTFRIGAYLFALQLEQVREVTLPPPITPIPHASNLVGGYVNLRGTIHLVIDLRQLLQAGEQSPIADHRLVLLESPGNDPFGVLVDAIGDIERLSRDRIEPPSSAMVELPGEDLLLGIGKRQGELCLLLDAERLIPLLEQSLTIPSPASS